jgi:TIR domain
MTDAPLPKRDVLFISKATPGDDEFALWLAPRLEAEGYAVYADIIRLDPGARWRKELTTTLQDRAIKMLLCCKNETLAANGVQEEIAIAEDLAKQLKDPNFIIPLRLAPFKKLFGIGGLQYVDFEKHWADGLNKLLKYLDKAGLPRNMSAVSISPNWEQYRRRNAITIKPEPEPLTSNWLRVMEMPDVIRYYEPTGAVDQAAMFRVCGAFKYHAEPYLRGFFSFAEPRVVNEGFQAVAAFAVTREINTLDFMRDGWVDKNLRPREATNFVQSISRKAWETTCRSLGLLSFAYSKNPGFHISKDQARIGQRIPWGTQGEKRSSMLRNKAKGHVWQFGVTALPAFWPFPHFRLKARVLFSEVAADEAGLVIEDKKKQHRLRRSVCKGWRNKQWHGRLRAFLELLCGESSAITLRVGEEASIRIESVPMFFTCPVTTDLPDQIDDDDEEFDDSTLTGAPGEGEEEEAA